eukprot:Tbor_TRINITY_DN5500_c6_g2::TRINITY_DN5500_c6_g2_i1::g.12839::m.12839
MFAALKRTDIVEVKLFSAQEEWRHIVSINGSSVASLLSLITDNTINDNINNMLGQEQVFPAHCIFSGGSVSTIQKPFKEIKRKSLIELLHSTRNFGFMVGLSDHHLDAAFFGVLSQTPSQQEELLPHQLSSEDLDGMESKCPVS